MNACAQNLSSHGKPIAEVHPELGPMLEEPEPVQFVGGPFCGVEAHTRMAECILIEITDGPCSGRKHWYERIGRSDGNGCSIVQHSLIDDDGRQRA